MKAPTWAQAPVRAWEVLMESRLHGPGLHQSFPSLTSGACASASWDQHGPFCSHVRPNENRDRPPIRDLHHSHIAADRFRSQDLCLSRGQMSASVRFGSSSTDPTHVRLTATSHCDGATRTVKVPDED